MGQTGYQTGCYLISVTQYVQHVHSPPPLEQYQYLVYMVYVGLLFSLCFSDPQQASILWQRVSGDILCLCH